jgi:hypothetical protein
LYDSGSRSCCYHALCEEERERHIGPGACVCAYVMHKEQRGKGKENSEVDRSAKRGKGAPNASREREKNDEIHLRLRTHIHVREREEAGVSPGKLNFKKNSSQNVQTHKTAKQPFYKQRYSTCTYTHLYTPCLPPPSSCSALALFHSPSHPHNCHHRCRYARLVPIGFNVGKRFSWCCYGFAAA